MQKHNKDLVKPRFLSLCDRAYSAILQRQGFPAEHKTNFQAPLLELKALLDEQNTRIVVLEEKLYWANVLVSRLEKVRENL